MKWYDISVRHYGYSGADLDIERDEYAHKWPDDGTWCRASDVDRERRRLLVKLCRERARRIRMIKYQITCRQGGRRWSECEIKQAFFRSLANALESNQPLTYFQRLGEDK